MRFAKLLSTLTLMAAFLTHCNVKEKKQKLNQGRVKADFIMNNLSKPEVIEQFPEKYFPHEHLKTAIDTLVVHCDLDKKEGSLLIFYNAKQWKVIDRIHLRVFPELR